MTPALFDQCGNRKYLVARERLAFVWPTQTTRLTAHVEIRFRRSLLNGVNRAWSYAFTKPNLLRPPPRGPQEGEIAG